MSIHETVSWIESDEGDVLVPSGEPKIPHWRATANDRELRLEHPYVTAEDTSHPAELIADPSRAPYRPLTDEHRRIGLRAIQHIRGDIL